MRDLVQADRRPLRERCAWWFDDMEHPCTDTIMPSPLLWSEPSHSLFCNCNCRCRWLCLRGVGGEERVRLTKTRPKPEKGRNTRQIRLRSADFRWKPARRSAGLSLPSLPDAPALRGWVVVLLLVQGQLRAPSKSDGEVDRRRF